MKKTKSVKQTIKAVSKVIKAIKAADPALAARKRKGQFAKPAKAVKQSKAPAPKDALGGRIGTTCSSINAVIIKAAGKGVTLAECVEALGIQHQLCSSQLVSLFKRKLATRAEETVANGKRVVFRYTVVSPGKEAA